MEIKLIEKKANPLFDREEFKFEIESNSVPGLAEVKNLVVEKFSFNSDLIRMQKIKGKFGRRTFEVSLDVYGSKEEFDRVVRKTKQEKEKEKKEAEERLKAEIEAKKATEEAKVSEEKTEATTEEVQEESVEEKKE